MRRGVLVVVTALVAVATGTLPGADASGSSTIVVRGAALPAGARVQLNAVGCESVFGRTSEPIVPTIGVVPGRTGDKRSVGFDLAGGNAVGSVGYVDQVAATTIAGMSVHADAGTTGVAYAGYQAPEDIGTSLMWIGRAALAVPAGSWTSVNVPGLGYDWTQYDMSTEQPVGGAVGPAGVPAFVRAMGGDGSGFYMVGFGCDGNAFNTDAWRIGTAAGATTYDFEGYTTRTTISGPDDPIAPSATATLTGAVVDGSGAPVDGRAVLEAEQHDGTWDTVAVAPGPHPSAVVRPDETTTYRWKLYDRARYEGSVSGTFTVEVQDAGEPSEAPRPSDDPADDPADDPSDQPSAAVTADPASQPASEPPADTSTPSVEASPSEPAAEETRSPDVRVDERTDEPADAPTGPGATQPAEAEAGTPG